MSCDGEVFQVELVDTAGTEQFMSLHSLYIKSGDGFALFVTHISRLSCTEQIPAHTSAPTGYSA